MLQVWPFLVSRNATVGYQTIVAPDFMIKSGTVSLLISKVGGRPADGLIRQHLGKTTDGRLTLVYQVLIAKKGMETLRDEHGRPIEWMVGFVLKNEELISLVDEQYISIALEAVVDAYWRFWQKRNPVPTETSVAMTIDPTRTQPLSTQSQNRKPSRTSTETNLNSQPFPSSKHPQNRKPVFISTETKTSQSAQISLSNFNLWKTSTMVLSIVIVFVLIWAFVSTSQIASLERENGNLNTIITNLQQENQSLRDSLEMPEICLTCTLFEAEKCSGQVSPENSTR